jgi:hypothetical protein
MSETAKEEEFLTEKSAEYQTQIDTRLMAAYTRIRTSVRNGLAVVSIERGASAGSFFTIPPQTQVEIASEKNYNRRTFRTILVDSVLADEEKKRWKNYFLNFKSIFDKIGTFFYEKQFISSSLNLSDYINF